jgi:hypothetical protein
MANNHYQKQLFKEVDEDVVSLIQQLTESMYLQYLEGITSFGPRVTGTDRCVQAGRYIYNEFKKMGLEVRYHNWSWSGRNGTNIEAKIKGLDASSDEIYIICGHYDTVPRSPGADDNGSGTAAVLSAANVMSQYTFNHTVKFVAFDSEEYGHLGSRSYVREAYKNGDNLVATLNADMMGYAESRIGEKRTTVYSNEESEWILDFTTDASQRYQTYIDIEVIPGGPYGGSDHASFWEVGYDAIFYWEYEFNPSYHSPGDVIENMNPGYATKVSKLIMATLAELSQLSENTPPDAPTIEGPIEGTAGEEYEYTVAAHDPHNQPIYFLIDWGDDTDTGWIGPYGSDEKVNVTHVWSEKGTYTIRVKAKDTHEEESDWATLKVNMPKCHLTSTILNVYQRILSIIRERSSLFSIGIQIPS